MEWKGLGILGRGGGMEAEGRDEWKRLRDGEGRGGGA